MGSFNVACSISNISISVGTQVVFFPLLPQKSGIMIPTKYMLEATDCFQPFSLPIKGIYNDYGSLEAIEHDENTEALERFFGLRIEEFVQHIGRDVPKGIKSEEKEAIYQQLSGMFVHRAIYDELIAFDLLEKNLANDYLTKEIAQFYGFQKVPLEEQLLFDRDHNLLMRKEGLPYDLKIGKHGATFVHKRHKEYYTFGFDKCYGRLIKQHWKQMTGTNFYDVFPKEYNFEQLSNEQYLYIKEKFKELTGAPLGFSDDQNDKYTMYSVKDFAAVYQTLTGEEADLSVWESISQYDAQYTTFQKKLIEQPHTTDTFTKTTYELHCKIIEELNELNQKMKTKNNFGFIVNNLEFAQFFRSMDYFKDLYLPYLQKGQLRQALTEYQAFYWSMRSCNRFFFPAMNGEQFENEEASSMLLKKSMELVEAQRSNDEA